MCFHAILQVLRTHIPSKNICAPKILMNSTQIPPDTPKHSPDNPMASLRNMTCQQTPTDTAKDPKKLTGAVWESLAMFLGICCCLLAFHVPRGYLGGVWEESEGCLGVSEWYSWKLEALEYVWGVYGFSILAVWSENTILAQPWMVRFSVNWPYWDIKIPKPPHISLPKMIGLGHFLQFLGSSERYYLLQLLLIAL